MRNVSSDTANRVARSDGSLRRTYMGGYSVVQTWPHMTWALAAPLPLVPSGKTQPSRFFTTSRAAMTVRVPPL